MTRTVRTRIAPSPTGFLHLGTARTALYSWAYARHHGGQFVLRIEDTDVARSTQDSVDQILASMKWLGLDYDEGPIYQMQRLDRYRAVIDQMIDRRHRLPLLLHAGRARCDEGRATEARGEKRRYDGTLAARAGQGAAARSRGRASRSCAFKQSARWRRELGRSSSRAAITINNREIDDLIIARPGADAAHLIGVPTYNFCRRRRRLGHGHHAM